MAPPPHESPKLRKLRERRIRSSILGTAHGGLTNRSGGWVTAQYCLDVMEAGPAQGVVPDGDEHLRLLLAELVTAGYLDYEDNREFQKDEITLHTETYRITATGIDQVNGHGPIDDDLDHGRLR